MPIQKELTHDCVRLLKAQMSYQYVGLIFSEPHASIYDSLLRFLCFEFCLFGRSASDARLAEISPFV